MSQVESTIEEKASLSLSFIVSKKSIKIKKLDIFFDERNKLDAYIVQCELYTKFNIKFFVTSQDVIFGVFSYLKKNAFNGFKKILKDFLNNKANFKKQEKKTKKIFESGKKYKKHLKKVFENINEKRIVERNLQTLRQTSFATQYMIKFQEYSINIQGKNETLTAKFYREFKNKIKNVIIIREKLDDFQFMMIKIIEIDNRQFEKKLEKREKYRTSHKHEKNNNHKNNHYDIVFMKIDFVNRRQKGKKSGQAEQYRKSRDMSTMKCYKCEKKRHYKRDCRSRRINVISRKVDTSEKQLNMMRRTPSDHNNMSGTGCYDDNCLIHKSSKKNSRGYLKTSKKLQYISVKLRDFEEKEIKLEIPETFMSKNSNYESGNDRMTLEKIEGKINDEENYYMTLNDFEKENLSNGKKIKSKIQDDKNQEYQDLFAKLCDDTKCIHLHKLIGLFKLKNNTNGEKSLVMNLLPKNVGKKKNEYGTLDDDYISKELHDKIKNLRKKILACQLKSKKSKN